MASYSTTTANTYSGLPINNGHGDYPCRTETLDAIRRVFENAVSTRNKNFFLRFDLHFPSGQRHANPERVFAKFMNSYFRHLKNADLDPLYVWCREQAADAMNPHFHFAVLLNGQMTQNIHGHLTEAGRFWALALGTPDAAGLVNWCTEDRNGNPQPNGVMIRWDKADCQEAYSACFLRASYLAKTHTKGNSPRGAREWGCSQV